MLIEFGQEALAEAFYIAFSRFDVDAFNLLGAVQAADRVRNCEFFQVTSALLRLCEAPATVGEWSGADGGYGM